MHCVASKYNPKTHSCRLHSLHSPTFNYTAEAIHAQSKHAKTKTYLYHTPAIQHVQSFNYHYYHTCEVCTAKQICKNVLIDIYSHTVSMHCFLAFAIKDDHHTFHRYIHSYVGHEYSILSLERYIHKSRNLCVCTAYPIPKIKSMQPCEHSHVEIRRFHALYSSQVCSFIAHTAQIATHTALPE